MTDNFHPLEESSPNALQNLPFNSEAEAALLGAMMMDNRIASECHWLPAEAFFEQVHGRIFAAIVDEVNGNRLASPITLRPRLAEDAALNELGGAGYLAKLTGNVAALVGARDFAQQIFELHRRRELAKALHKSLIDALDTSGGTSCEELIERVDEAVTATNLLAPVVTNTVASLDAEWLDAIERHDEIEAGKIEPAMAVKGFDDYNDILGGGMRRGNMIVVAGRPGMGKTAVACRIAATAALAGLGVRFQSLEMTKPDLVERQICDMLFDYDNINGFTYDQLRRGKVNPSEMNRIKSAREQLTNLHLTYDDASGLKASALIGRLRRHKRNCLKSGKPFDVAIIDYLGLIEYEDAKGFEVQEISKITKSLKNAAKELDIAIILLSQLNRGVEGRDDKRPMLADLRSSGSIEQDADAVIFLYRDEYYLEKAEPKKNTSDAKSIKAWEDWHQSMNQARDRLELIAGKTRAAKVTRRNCYFFGAYQAVRGSKYMTERQ